MFSLSRFQREKEKQIGRRCKWILLRKILNESINPERGNTKPNKSDYSAIQRAISVMVEECRKIFYYEWNQRILILSSHTFHMLAAHYHKWLSDHSLKTNKLSHKYDKAHPSLSIKTKRKKKPCEFRWTDRLFCHLTSPLIISKPILWVRWKSTIFDVSQSPHRSFYTLITLNHSSF